MKIVTDHIHPPIPCRDFDWCAVTEDYDGESGDPIGYGATEQAAIDDLMQQMEDV